MATKRCIEYVLAARYKSQPRARVRARWTYPWTSLGPRSRAARAPPARLSATCGFPPTSIWAGPSDGGLTGGACHLRMQKTIQQAELAAHP